MLAEQPPPPPQPPAHHVQSIPASRRVQVEVLEVIGTLRARPDAATMRLRQQQRQQALQDDHEATRKELQARLDALGEQQSLGASSSAVAEAARAKAAAEGALAAHASLVDAATGQVSEPDPAGRQRFVEGWVYSRATADKAHTKPHVIERQLAPLMKVHTAQQLPAALAEAQQVRDWMHGACTSKHMHSVA